MAQSIPEPSGFGLLNGYRFGTQTLHFLEHVQSRFDDLAAVPIPFRAPLVIVTNPVLVHEALGRPDAFARVPTLDAAALIATTGLVQAEGALWKQQRSIITPAFTGQRVIDYANTTGRRATHLADRWAAAGRREVNLHREMTTLTVRVASEILLGEDIGADRADQFYEWMEIAGREFEFGFSAVAPEWVPNRISPDFRDAARGIRALAEELIDRRRSAVADGADATPTDMLSMLLHAAERDDVELPDNQIRDEVATFLIAGHETTALSLTYTFGLLSSNTRVRDRVRAEAASVFADNQVSFERLSDLPFTTTVYREALRLYPPAWAVFRRATDDVSLGDYVVHHGSAVVLPQWSIHRDGRYFENPTRFDPNRWDRRNPTAVAAYFPFSSGPHACIGRRFALAGATLTLARLVRDFDIRVHEDELDRLRITPTLRPIDGVSATIRSID